MATSRESLKVGSGKIDPGFAVRSLFMVNGAGKRALKFYSVQISLMLALEYERAARPS
jgi:hypothetical protein